MMVSVVQRSQTARSKQEQISNSHVEFTEDTLTVHKHAISDKADTSHSTNETGDDVNVFENIAMGRHDDFLYNRC